MRWMDGMLGLKLQYVERMERRTGAKSDVRDSREALYITGLIRSNYLGVGVFPQPRAFPSRQATAHQLC